MLEWCTEDGKSHHIEYVEQYGIIGKSLKHDARNRDGKLGMVSLIADVIK